jgi:fumarate reductase iron-sulfur subunit
MLINGRPGLACRTLTLDLPAPTRLAPLPGLRAHRRSQRQHGQVDARHERAPADLGAGRIYRERDPADIEAPMEPALAEEIYELERCIECGCCVAACGTAQMREDFVGAVGLNKLARFRLDPRDDASDAALLCAHRRRRWRVRLHEPARM